MRFIDMMRGQSELVVTGRLEDWRRVGHGCPCPTAAGAERDRCGRPSVCRSSSPPSPRWRRAGALLLGAYATFGGTLDAAAAAIGFFAALALFEVAAPLARGIGELGRMVDAARRIDRQLRSAAGSGRSHRVARWRTGAPLADLRGRWLRSRRANACSTASRSRSGPGRALRLPGQVVRARPRCSIWRAGWLIPERGKGPDQWPPCPVMVAGGTCRELSATCRSARRWSAARLRRT